MVNKRTHQELDTSVQDASSPYTASAKRRRRRDRQRHDKVTSQASDTRVAEKVEDCGNSVADGVGSEGATRPTVNDAPSSSFSILLFCALHPPVNVPSRAATHTLVADVSHFLLKFVLDFSSKLGAQPVDSCSQLIGCVQPKPASKATLEFRNRLDELQKSYSDLLCPRLTKYTREVVRLSFTFYRKERAAVGRPAIAMKAVTYVCSDYKPSRQASLTDSLSSRT